MKIIEKKCPGCGAALKFGQNDTSVTCEYCGKSLHIQRDENKFAKLAEQNWDRAYQFVDDYGKPIAKGFAAVSIGMMIIPFFIFFAIVGIFGFAIFSFSGAGDIDFDENPIVNEWEQEQLDRYNEERKTLVKKLEQIDSVSLQTFRDASVTKLKNRDVGSGHGWAGHTSTKDKFTLVKDWTLVGSYLLVGKEKNENTLYDVYEHSFKVKSTKKTVTLYVAVSYSNIKLTDEGIVNHNYMGTFHGPDVDLITGDAFSSTNGYESVEKLYNTLLRSQSGEFTIEGTEGIYVEAK